MHPIFNDVLFIWKAEEYQASVIFGQFIIL